MHNDAAILTDLQASHKVLSLDELRALPEAKEFEAGVYFLWQDNQLQYIGKSKHVLERLVYQNQVNRAGIFNQSRSAVVIPHDRHTCIVLESGFVHSPRIDGLMRDLERLYIGSYPTPFNNPEFHAYT